MRTIQKAFISTVLAICLIPAANAAKRFDAQKSAAPRTASTGLRIVTMSPPEGLTVAPVAIGAPNSMTSCDAWVTSDYEADVFTTNFLWCDYENLELVQGFFSPVGNPIHASVTIRNRSGVLVYSAAGDLAIDADLVNYVLVDDIGQLPADFYKVIFKIKQGIKVVGQTFWFQVSPEADPLCTPPQ